MISPQVMLLASLPAAVAAAAVGWLVVPPTRRLADRVRPYTIAARTSLGRSADVAAPAADGATLRRLFGPLLAAAVGRFGRYLDATSEQGLRTKLRQAGVLQDVADPVLEYRIRQMGTAVGAAIAAGVVGAVVGVGAAPVLGLVMFGFVAGAARLRARVDRIIRLRRERMQIELYTVNQLLALNVRVGGGVLQALQRVVARGHGEVVGELRDVLRAHEAGVPGAEALLRVAAQTPEPQVGRTLRLLASGTEYGSDLASALLAHSEDIRTARRETLRRAATRRRAAMLLPTIAVLAPVMLLFIAAPLPSLLFDIR